MHSRWIEWLGVGVALGTWLFATPGGAAQPKSQRSLLIVSKATHTLAIVDPANLKVIERVPVGPDPHEVVASSDGKVAYVSNTGFGSFHELNVIDLVARKALPAIDTAPLLGPHGLAFVGGKVWFTAQGSKAVARYDPATAKIDWIMGTGQDRTHMLHVTADEKKIYTTNVDSGTVSILENVLLQPTVPPTGVLPPGAKPRLDWVQTAIPAGQGAEGFDVSPDGQELWTALPGGSLSVVDLANKKLKTTLDAKLLGAHRLKFTPDGKRVLAVSVRTGELVVYDAGARKEIKRLNIGHGAAMLMDPEGSRVFVSCTPDNDVAVIDLKTLEVINGATDERQAAIRKADVAQRSAVRTLHHAPQDLALDGLGEHGDVRWGIDEPHVPAKRIQQLVGGLARRDGQRRLSLLHVPLAKRRVRRDSRAEQRRSGRRIEDVDRNVSGSRLAPVDGE